MLKFIILLIIPVFCKSVNGQICSRQYNKFDKEKQRTGLWIEYYDIDKKSISAKIHYRKGSQRGICWFYHQNGEPRLKWHYYPKRIRAKYYFENGKLEQKGWSKVEDEKGSVHYYWHGKWKFYDEERKLIRTTIYENGEEKEIR